MKTRTRIAAGISITVLTLAAGAATVAVASPDESAPDHSAKQKPNTPPSVSQDQAVQTVLAQSPGAQVEKVELEVKDNYWSIDLQLPGSTPNQHLDYKVDASTGTVIKVDKEAKHQPKPAPTPGTPGKSPEKSKHQDSAAEKAKEQAHDAKEKATGDKD